VFGGHIFVSLLLGALWLAAFLLPIALGFTFVRADANRLGQPGWLWALITIPLGWLALLAYLIVRAVTPSRQRAE
jgi:hypothetical protein